MLKKAETVATALTSTTNRLRVLSVIQLIAFDSFHVGTSQQRVKAQILVALIAYLLVHILKYSMRSGFSVGDGWTKVSIRASLHKRWS